jgi:hypothetical protein
LIYFNLIRNREKCHSIWVKNLISSTGKDQPSHLPCLAVAQMCTESVA